MFCCLVVSRHFLRGRRGGEQPADNRHGFSQLVSPSCLVCSTGSEEALEMVGGLALGLGCLKEIGENLGTHVPRNAGPDTRRRPHAGCQEPGVERGRVHQYPDRRGSRYSPWSVWRVPETRCGKGGHPSMSRQTRVRLTAGLYVGCQDLVRRRSDIQARTRRQSTDSDI